MTRRGATGPGPHLCGTWLRCYLRGVPDDIANERRAEIWTDLWDQSHDAERSGQSRARYHLSVAWRVLGGVFADLAWRRHILRAHPGGPAFAHRVATMSATAVIVLAAIGMMPSFMLLQLLATQRVSALGVLWILGANALSLLLIVGLVWRAKGTRPAFSTVLLVVGSPAPSFAVFWLPPVYLLSLAIAVTALMSIPTRSVRERRGANA